MSERGPLSGIRIVITRDHTQAEPWLKRLSELGARALCLPMVEFVACDPALLDVALYSLAQYDWVAFTSANAVRFVAARCGDLGLDSTFLNTVHIAAVGGATTQSLCERGVSVTLTARAATGRGLADELIARGVAGQRVLLPATRAGRPELRELLTAAGAIVDVAPVYDTLAPPNPDPRLLHELRHGTVDAVVLASPSAARNLYAALDGEPASNVRVICIGHTTAGAAHELGYQVAGVAREPSVDGLVDVLVELFSATGRTSFRPA